MKRSILVGISLLSILLLLATWGFSQAISGDLVGVVKDTTGAVVPNAVVEATNVATSQKLTHKTNAQGEYHFVNLPVGTYTVAVTASGLNGVVDNVKVELNQTQTANITAAVAGTSTAIEVSETGATIDSTTPTIATTFTAKDAQDLSITALGGASSGVLNLSLLNSGVASSGGVGAGSGPSVGGNRPRNNNFTVEGVDNNSLSVTGPLITIPNDAVGSFTVLQNQFSSEFGHSSGGQFNQTIKSGTNTFHGTAYEYFQNGNLNAQDSQTALAQVSNGLKPFNPPYNNNRYGGNLGGPILKNKLFFFTDWEYNNIGQPGPSSTACAPTAAGYTTLDALFPNSINLQQLQKYLPAGSNSSATTCPAGAIIGVQPGVPTSLTGDGSLPNATFIPVGDVGFAHSSYQNYLNTANSFDWIIGQNDSLRGRLAYTKNPGTDLQSPAQIPTFWLNITTTYWLATLAEYHNFGTSVNNEFRFGFNRYNQAIPSGSFLFPGLGTFPNLQIFELNGVQLGPDPNSPQFTIQNIYSFVDNVSWVKGRHTFRFGGEFRWIISPQSFTQRKRGDYEWSYTSDYLNDFSPNPNIGDFAERSSGAVTYYGNKKAFYGYANDEWRVTPTVTLSLGLRYEYTGEPLGTQLQALNAISNVPGLITFSAPTADKTNFLPRVGLAWAPNPETAVRVGYALQSDVIYDNLGILSLPPQVNQTCDTTSLTNYVPTAGCFYSFTKFLASGGLPSIPGQITNPATARADTSAYIPNQTLPYAETWTASIQRQIGKVYTLEVRYLGTRGIKLPVQTRLNRESPVQPWAYLPTYLSMPSQATLDSLPYTLAYLKSLGNAVPAYANAGFVQNITSFQPLGASKYNGLNINFSRNFTNGLQFQVAYTWSHLLDNSTADVFSTVLTPRRPQDFQCFNCDFGTSALDRRQRFTAFAVYDLPFFKNDNWLMKNLVGNWQFSPIYTLQAPEYATCQSASDANLNGDSAPDRCLYNPNGVPNTGTGVTALRNSSHATVAYLANNPTAQYIVAGQGAFTTAARNTLATPWTNNWDFSVLKRINITERQAISFSLLAVNLFNHAQYVPGYPVVNDVQSYGQTAGPIRNTLIPNPAVSSTFTNWASAFSNHPRQLVLVLKYSF